MTTLHRRARLPRQDFADTAPLYPAEAATEVGAHPQRRRADHAHIGCGAFTPAFLALALVAACAALVLLLKDFSQ